MVQAERGGLSLEEFLQGHLSEWGTGVKADRNI